MNSKFVQTLLGVTFATSLVVANVTAAKLAFFALPVLGGVAVPAGFVGIGVAFLCSDLLGELYGKDAARRAVNATILALVVGWALIYAAIVMPTAPFYENAAAFETVLGSSAVIVVASIVTMVVSQNIDVSVFHAIRRRTGERYKFVRNVGSTVTSQFVDTVLFIGLAFVVLPPLFGGSAVPLAVATSLIVGQYVVKVAVALLDTPLFYLISGLSKRRNSIVTA